MIRQILEDCVFRLSMPAHSGQPKGDLSHRPATFSVDQYDEWRSESLKDQFEMYYDWGLIRGKRVLDFGCGTGLARSGHQGKKHYQPVFEGSQPLHLWNLSRHVMVH
jgi:hypothetical protein